MWLLVVAACTLLSPRSALAEAERTIMGFEIHVHTGRDSAFDYIWSELGDRIGRIRTHLGPHVLQSGEIHVVADINQWFRERGEPERAPRWAQALALPSRRIIILRMPDPQPINTLTHELSHLGVREAVQGHHVPR